MRPLPLAACLALVTALPFAAVAQDAAQPAAAPATTEAASAAPAAAGALVGDPKTGHQLTYTCQGCHGVTGYKNAYPTYSVPKITGQSQEFLVNALTAYKKGTRKHPTMQAQAQSFSDEDIAAIASYLSSLKK